VHRGEENRSVVIAAPPRAVLAADVFQQRFSRVDGTGALYRMVVATTAAAFLMIFLSR
jgi:hypothetical protein